MFKTLSVPRMNWTVRQVDDRYIASYLSYRSPPSETEELAITLLVFLLLKKGVIITSA